MYRINRHPILDIEEPDAIFITVDGEKMAARKGDTIASALLARGRRVFRYTEKYHETRGLFCGIGQCTDCVMEVDGVPNVRTCVTPVREGMVVVTQKGRGEFRNDGPV
ncbi:MAG: (2Fe-2S)-binding protein [Treponema sp.]|jgi:predicted molibdopterin-dependent oxidoreductase YjgC|nr:(2Fe-2S)-binding protein [Treponema sp.]